MIALIPLAWTALWLILAVAVDRYGRDRAIVGAYDAIVVAGAGTAPDGTVSHALKRRVDAAVDAFHAGRAPILAFTGGRDTQGNVESAAARTYALSRGVPDAAIVVEDRSHSTEENARYIAERLGRVRILVVSDCYHVFRCEQVFARYFAEVDGLGALPPPPTRVKMALREVLVTVVYALRGRLGGPVIGEIKRLFELAWPAVVGQLGWMLMGVVDTLMVGHYSENALAGVGLGNTWAFGASILALGAAQGLDPVFAQAFGAGDPRAAGRALAGGCAVVGLIGLPVAIAHEFAGAGLGALGEPADLLPIADAYCKVLVFSLPALFVFAIVRGMLQARGRMFPATVAVFVANIANFGLNASLVYGRFGFPELGAVGSAWATLISRTIMAVILVWIGRDTLAACAIDLRDAFRPAVVGALAAISVPVGLQVGLEVWAFTGTTLLMGAFGKTAVAAHIVALNLSSVSFMVPYGISAAAASRVGNELGAGRPWTRPAWTAVACGASVMSVSAMLFLAFPATLAAIYSPDAAVIALAATLLPIAALFQLFDGTQAVAFGVLRGAGDTRMPMVINLIGYYLLGLPLGMLLAHGCGLGPRGLWLGLTAGLSTVASLLLVRLRSTAARGGFRVV